MPRFTVKQSRLLSLTVIGLLVLTAVWATLAETGPDGLLVRERYTLASGTVEATTTRAYTKFVDTESGALIKQFDMRIYAFSHQERLCVAFNEDRELILLDYPALTTMKVLDKVDNGGPMHLAFSPDDRYLEVQYCNHYPLTDEDFQDPVFDKTRFWVKLYNLETGESIPEVNGIAPGEFSEDPGIYKMADGRLFDLKAVQFMNSDNR